MNSLAIVSYFFDSTSEDPRVYSAADFAKAFGIILTDGVIANDDGTLGFVLGGTNYTTVYAGRAVVQGHFIELTGTEVLTVTGGTYEGMIVLRVDIAGARNTTLAIRTDRTPQKDNAIWEYPLYNISVTNGVISTLPVNVRAQGGAVAKTAANVPTWYPDPNGVVLKISNHEVFFTTAEPAKAAKRIWIQTV